MQVGAREQSPRSRSSSKSVYLVLQHARCLAPSFTVTPLNDIHELLVMQVIKEVFCWTREPMEVRRISARKEAVLTEMLGDMQPLLAPDVPKFMESLAASKVNTYFSDIFNNGLLGMHPPLG